MNYIHEVALLAAVALPFVTLAGLNVYLWSVGERGTLVVPSSEPLPSLVRREILTMPIPMLTAAQQALRARAANDVKARQAA